MFLMLLALRILAEWTREEAVPASVTFANDVQPILERRCTPCHFPGGSMHEKLPFDRSETIVTLGTRLFTRIKKDDEQAVIRAFLATAREPREPSSPPPQQALSSARTQPSHAPAARLDSPPATAWK